MGKLSRRDTEVVTSTYPHWPQYCNQCKCDPHSNETVAAQQVKKTSVAIMEVSDESGSRLTGCFSDFGDSLANGKPLRTGFNFRAWHTFCEVCYLKHVTRQGKNQALTFRQWEKLQIGKPKTDRPISEFGILLKEFVKKLKSSSRTIAK